MMSKVGVNKKRGESSGSQNRLLKDVGVISKALHLDKSSSRNSTTTANSPSKSKSKPEASKEDKGGKDKKSKWNWRALKSFSLTGNRRFNCGFHLQVHLIEGLPSTLDGASLCVYWKRRDEVLVTPPAKVIQGVAEFEEMLTYTCSVYGSMSGPQNSAKYEAKHFSLYASIIKSPELDLGKHKVDLTRLLPLTLEELEDEKSSGKWTTSFRLSGTARGAIMNVSFGYVVVGDNTSATRDDNNAPNSVTYRKNSLPLMNPDNKLSQSDRNISVRRTGSLPSFTSQYSSRTVDELKDLYEILPLPKSELACSIDILCKKFDEEKTCSPQDKKPELDVFTENLELIKSDAYPSSDIRKEKPEEHPGNEGSTCSPVHHSPELDAFQENLETVKPDRYPLPDSGKENPDDCETNGFSVVDQSIAFSSNEPFKLDQSIIDIETPVNASTVDGTLTLDTASIQVSSDNSVKHDSLDEANDSSREKAVEHELSYKKDDFLCTKEILLQELESALNRVSELEAVAMESPNIMESKSEYKMRQSDSLEEVTESVASEFLSLLGIDHSPLCLSSESEPQSPRERLLRQFEEEALAEGFSLFDFDLGKDNEAEGGYDASFESEHWKFSEGIESSPLLQDLKKGHLVESQAVRSKQRAQMLEDLETEALMREWGLNEKAFERSPPKDFTGFGSPIHLPPEEPLVLPPLAEGLGPFLQTKDGGFLRSMNPSLFRNTKSGGSLIMQVSNSVVVPAEMGSGIMEILQCLASVGIEKLSMQANKLMPLEDITGKTLQQIAWEATPVLEETVRQRHLQPDLATGQDASVQRGLKGTSSGPRSDKFSSSSVGNQTGSEFVSLENLASLAMDKIETLSMEGLRIQSGMSEEEAPSNIIAQSSGDISALKGKGVNIGGSLGLDGAAGLRLLDTKNSSDGVDGIMGLSLTLDEWMRLDSGEIDDVDNISEYAFKLLAAHHANSFDLRRLSSQGEKEQVKGPGRKCGLLGNNFTVALMVQLRDPLRNYEPVGTPMLALIQTERVFFPPKQKIYSSMSEVGNNNDEDDECEIVAKVEMKCKKKVEKSSEEEGIPQFRITEVHLAGLKNEPHKKEHWGTTSQQRSGSRWLLANGMGKSNKHPLMKSKAASKCSIANVQPGDTLWSMSPRIYGTGAKWKALAALNPHIRNPNVIIPNETIRLR